MTIMEDNSGLYPAYDSPTFGKDGSFTLDKPVGSASISPCGRDVVLASYVNVPSIRSSSETDELLM